MRLAESTEKQGGQTVATIQIRKLSSELNEMRVQIEGLTFERVEEFILKQIGMVVFADSDAFIRFSESKDADEHAGETFHILGPIIMDVSPPTRAEGTVIRDAKPRMHSIIYAGFERNGDLLKKDSYVANTPILTMR
jgi:hypothetical protein